MDDVNFWEDPWGWTTKNIFDPTLDTGAEWYRQQVREWFGFESPSETSRRTEAEQAKEQAQAAEAAFDLPTWAILAIAGGLVVVAFLATR